ncbi:hypothetical protein Tco_0448878 [Tanacetum coccineum]
MVWNLDVAGYNICSGNKLAKIANIGELQCYEISANSNLVLCCSEHVGFGRFSFRLRDISPYEDLSDVGSQGPRDLFFRIHPLLGYVPGPEGQCSPTLHYLYVPFVSEACFPEFFQSEMRYSRAEEQPHALLRTHLSSVTKGIYRRPAPWRTRRRMTRRIWEEDQLTILLPEKSTRDDEEPLTMTDR